MSSPRYLRADRDLPSRSRPRPRPGPGRRRTWPQRLLLIAGCGVALLFLAAASMVGYGLAKWNSVDRVGLDTASAADGEPMNILLVGSDSREGESPGEAAEVAGKRTDTIMVVRLDPRSEQVSVLSFPRDLWLPIAGTGESARINSAYNEPGEQQVLIDTIQQNFGIEINHWVEVDFEGFRQLVDSIGGVTLYFDRGLRDKASGLYIYDYGCVNLDGDMALAYARSRKAEYDTPDGWVRDPQSDLSRIERQQTLMTEALGTALGQARSSPLRLRELIDIGTANVSIDDGLGLGDVLDLGEGFKDLDTDRFQTVALPTEPRPGDEDATVVVDERAAEPILNVFRGLDPGEISPANVEVTVLNGTVADPAGPREGLAGDVSAALATIGFEVGTPGDADEPYEHTTIYHAPGELTYAQRVARHLTGGVVLDEDATLQPGHVTVVAGRDFASVHEDATPVDELLPTPGAPATTAAPGTEADDTVPPTLPSGPATTTPAQVGAVPPDAC